MHCIICNAVKYLITGSVKMNVVILDCDISVKGSLDYPIVPKDVLLFFLVYPPLYPNSNFILLFVQIIIPAWRYQERILR